MDYKGSKRRVLILGLIMVVLITAHASKDSYDAEKASKKKKKWFVVLRIVSGGGAITEESL